MKLSLIGYYGSNFGDLLMLNVLIDYYSQYYEQINIYTYGIEANLSDSLALNSSKCQIEVFTLTGIQKITYKTFLKTVKNSKYILWGGGTCFMDQGGTGGIKYMIGAYFCKVRVLYMGIGIDSYSKIRTRLIMFTAVLFSKALYFRDEKSLLTAKSLTLNLMSYKIKYVPDIANIKTVQHQLAFNDYIVFCCRDLSNYQSLNNEKVNKYLVDLTISICNKLKIKRVFNLVCDFEVDQKPSQLANELFLQEGISVNNIYGYKIEDSLIAIRNSKFVITSRLHPAVVAQNLNIPYALYNYSDKNKKFLEEAKEASRLIGRYNFEEFVPDFKKPKSENLENIKQSIFSVLTKYSK
ncbi:polysaccharide pyruvyl transferase family protein [Flavobacterium sp. GN10]|uniref:Polysaccharide pyruvyl transferase family protein n=1 Tax=Flavobacterium tagetis TaxID=2801336 RepID=A0ABS1KIM0_9FLAO|nr:polysaccharide pyruvyl transferase family protein [Flavobacterium tagetis]MBL0739316.1 polysaccharide pyruvyl transferase family protein [Flavobacterium tagetis]